MIGDRWKDIDAGYSKCKTIMMETNYIERSPYNPPDVKVKSFKEAVDWIAHKTLN